MRTSKEVFARAWDGILGSEYLGIMIFCALMLAAIYAGRDFFNKGK